MTSVSHGAAALDRRGVAWGLVGVAVTLAITFVGSDGLLGGPWPAHSAIAASH